MFARVCQKPRRSASRSPANAPTEPRPSETIKTLKSDLVFLDVQMPEMDGFDVIDAVGPDRMPRTIFATAYEEYAIRAFDAQAMDYLLKPFDEERFRKPLDRARKDLQRGSDAKPDESIRR